MSMIKFLQKAIITYHCVQWHTVFLSVWILYSELSKNNWCHSQLSYKQEKKHCKVTYLNWKANNKEHTVEAL